MSKEYRDQRFKVVKIGSLVIVSAKNSLGRQLLRVKLSSPDYPDWKAHAIRCWLRRYDK